MSLKWIKLLKETCLVGNRDYPMLYLEERKTVLKEIQLSVTFKTAPLGAGSICPIIGNSYFIIKKNTFGKFYKASFLVVLMNGVRTIEAGKYNPLLATALKEYKEFKAPEWVFFVKSGHGKKRPIDDENFWHNRTASVLRQIYLRGTVGVQRLRTRYGNRKDRGKQPAHFAPSSGKIIRMILQQAEAAQILTKNETNKKGRMLTEKGKK